MSILGTRVVRAEDPALLTGHGTYVPNLPLEGAVHVHYVRSSVAHARITSIDASAAKDAPGVVAVFTAADVDLAPGATMAKGFNRPWLAADVVRYVGEIVAIVVTEEELQGEDAIELVAVEYDPLPPIVDPFAAFDAPPIVADTESNVSFQMPVEADDSLFADCEVTVSQRILNQRLAACPLGVRAAAAQWEGGRLTQWSTNQHAHAVKVTLARTYGLESEQVRVITPDVGGGFGPMSGTYPSEVLVPWVARTVGRPARWTENRSEHMVDFGHGRGQVQTCTLGGDRDGTLKAFKLSVVQDSGAYPGVGTVLPNMTRMMASGVYDIAKIEFDARSAITNTTPVQQYRGAGRPEAAAAIERMVDLFAAEIGMDPAQVRYKNFFPPEAFPLRTASGGRYDSGDYKAALDKALAAAGYEELRAEQARRRQSGDTRQLGIGLSSYVEITNPVRDSEYGSIELLPGGKAKLRTGSSAHGQGHHTTFAMLAADLTGIPFEDIEVIHGDTDEVPRGGGTGGSKSAQLGGSALRGATLEAIDRARGLAAQLLEANPEDVVLDADSGKFHVAGTPAVSRSWAEVADAAAASEDGRLFAEFDFKPEGSAFPFGSHVCVVEVDTETGEVRIVRYVACDDAGVMLNPLLVEGQVHGGLAQGIAQALYEEFQYDADGNPLTGNFLDYLIPSAAEFPSYERIAQETPTHLNPLGAKGIGESGTIGATPAVQNAVVDALAHLGVRHVDMPCSPERVWAAINQAQG